MKKETKLLGSVVVAALLALGTTGCDSSDNNEGGNNDVGGYAAKFEARPVAAQVEELMGGVIGISDEVGSGKMAEPLGEDTASADATRVESQFSWNSTMDFYNNIASIKHVWDGGLKDIATKSEPTLTTKIDGELTDALAAIVAISDADGDKKLETSDLVADDGKLAFRNQIFDDAGRAKITDAIGKLKSLNDDLVTLKTKIAPAEGCKTKVKAVVDNVIIPTYENLGKEATKLTEDLQLLLDNPTVENVEKARTQWRATRQYWEGGEGFIFGPVDTLGVDPKVDSWPVDKAQLDGALDGWDPELSNIDGFPTTMKGFHAIEYLLFGDGTHEESANNALTRLTSGEDNIKLRYLVALGKSFQKDINSLVAAWK